MILPSEVGASGMGDKYLEATLGPVRQKTR